MKLLKLIAAAAAIAVAVTGLETVPADASTTTVTFTVLAGTLSVAQGGTTSLGTNITPQASPNVLAPVALPLTTVTDTRAGIAGNWTDVVTISDFTTTAPVQTIAKSSATIYSGLITVTGVGVSVPTLTPGVGDGATLASLHTEVGSTVSTFTPSIILTVPPSAAAGAYSGVITQTVT
jgi:hypothetical protein